MFWILLGMAVVGWVCSEVGAVLAHRGRVRLTDHQNGTFTISDGDHRLAVLLLAVGGASIGLPRHRHDSRRLGMKRMGALRQCAGTVAMYEHRTAATYRHAAR